MLDFNDDVIKKGFVYEMHSHSSGCSACAHSTPEEMVQAYHKAGYQGIVQTNHFIYGNNCVPKNYPWERKMECFWEEYLKAKKEAEKYDMDVLFGIEYYYGRGKEILTYGIDLEFLKKYPDLSDTPVEVYAQRVHEAGGFLSLAHPFRIAPYIDATVPIKPHLADGLEVYNANTEFDQNQRSYKLAKAMGKVMTSGGDAHQKDEKLIGMAGLVFPHRIRSGQELVQALKAGEGTPVWNGKPIQTYEWYI